MLFAADSLGKATVAGSHAARESHLHLQVGWQETHTKTKKNTSPTLHLCRSPADAGLLVPNLMNQMVVQNKRLNLQAVALGNACTGTPGQSKQAPGQCNLGGSFDTQYVVEPHHTNRREIDVDSQTKSEGG